MLEHLKEGWENSPSDKETLKTKMSFRLSHLEGWQLDWAQHESTERLEWKAMSLAWSVWTRSKLYRSCVGIQVLCLDICEGRVGMIL